MARPEVRLLRPPMSNGLHLDVEMERYLTSDAAGSSDLNNMRRSPAYCQYWRERVSPSGPAQAWGTALHARLLEPENYDKIVGRLPEGLNLRTKDGRAEAAAIAETHEVVIKEEEHEDILAAEASVMQNSNAASLLRAEGPTEATIFAEDPITGCPRKIRPDKAIPGSGIILDVKSTRMPNMRTFTVQAWNLGYHRKMSYYIDTMNLLAEISPAPLYTYGVVLLVQNTAPFECALLAVGGETLEIGATEWRPELTRFAECRETGVWPQFSDDIATLEKPSWAQGPSIGEGF